jgi:hypothetical protein
MEAQIRVGKDTKDEAFFIRNAAVCNPDDL